ncbi:MAG: amidohydrolase family protein [Anaerolineae bacterium]|nr:amidohydrolase family protein [Anaerolineae bacterium]
MDFVLAGGTLIDGTGRDPVENAAVHIKNGRIEWVGKLSDLPSAAKQAQEKDVSGKWLLPGIIDAHIHVCWNGEESIFELLERDRDMIVLEATAIVKRILEVGTTTVRDIGGHDYVEMALRRAINAGFIPGPRMKTSGKVIAMTGGHAHFIAREADGPEEVRKAAREQIKAGADTVKLMATGGSATPGQDIHASQLTLEEMAAAVQAAHSMGRTVAAHAHGKGGIKNGLLAGLDSIEHGTYLDEETADLMLERGAALVMTLAVANPDLSGELSPTQKADVERRKPNFAKAQENGRNLIALAREKGIFIGCGTDAGGNPLAVHRFSMAREIQLMVEYGMPPLEALKIATCNNARVLRWENEIGSVETGKYADIQRPIGRY